MENATKALLIAAAVLVAILIISLGLVVYNMSAEVMDGIDLNAQEVQAHNEQFVRYLGDAQRGNQVNALLAQVLTNNTTQTDEGRRVSVYQIKNNATQLLLAATSTTSAKKVDTGKTYKVWEKRDEKSSLITELYIQQQ